ncbi:MAG: hypothetical protein Q9221_007555 [Calogaya cf. arnoldii]
MEQEPSHLKPQNKEDAAATFDLPRLTRANVASIPSIPELHRKPMTAVGTAGGLSSATETSIPWRPDPRAPIYQPLNIAPLGMRSHCASTPLAAEVSALETISCHSRGSEPAKQSVSHARKVPPPPRANKSYRGSLNIPSFPPNPSRETALQLPDRRFKPFSSPRAPNSTAARRSSPGGSVESPAVPIPLASYLAQTATTTTKRSTAQPLLLVLDLNGTLLYRPKASSAYRPRPSLESFLSHCVSNYKVLVWSSATPQNVTGICSRIFTSKQRKLLLGEWGRDTLNLTALQYSSKVQVYKRLDRVWNLDRIQRTHPGFQMGQRWGQWNTLLLDDSVLKSSAQPYNAVVVPEFTKKGVTEEVGGSEVLAQVVAYLETARTFDNVSSFVRDNPFQVDDRWRWDWARAGPLCVDNGRESDEESGGVNI